VLQVLEAVLERLQDFEDKVRSRAIIAICEAAMAFPEVSPSFFTFYSLYKYIYIYFI